MRLRGDWSWSAVWRRLGVGGILMILAVATTLVLAYQQVQLHKQNHDEARSTSCQTRLNEQFIEAISQRAKYSDEDRDNLTTLVKAIAHARSGEDTLKAVQRYIQVSDRIDQDRKRHPYPKLTGRCN